MGPSTLFLSTSTNLLSLTHCPFHYLFYLNLNIQSLTGKLCSLIKIPTRLRRYGELRVRPLRGKLRPQYLESLQTSTHIDTVASLKTVSLVKLCFKINSEKGGIILATRCPDSSLQRQKGGEMRGRSGGWRCTEGGHVLRSAFG